ncbi:MAG: tRNA (adenosine(37)-N6)-threonylcarbamoyltransferase complex ATPase subunit type 1 TsaE [Ignavibacteria bacterium]|nr:tRNA (adenosine(37)-N6)-threonylcarbamoyltransferase complex ATPase subunit type 1 TsaE [Ignavibacteria bacterium]
MRIVSGSANETIKQGEIFSKNLKAGDVIGLEGDLGTGKTQFVKGICNGFSVSEVVNSPTFIIVNEYSGESGSEALKIYHFDLYRLNMPEELGTIGFDEYIESGSICLIEWPELAEKYLGKSFKKVKFSYGTGENDRIIEIID